MDIDAALVGQQQVSATGFKVKQICTAAVGRSGPRLNCIRFLYLCLLAGISFWLIKEVQEEECFKCLSRWFWASLALKLLVGIAGWSAFFTLFQGCVGRDFGAFALWWRAKKIKQFPDVANRDAWPQAHEILDRLGKRWQREGHVWARVGKSIDDNRWPDHLSLGMTRFAMRDAILMFLPGYVRDDGGDNSYLDQFPEIVGYDLAAAIRRKMDALGYNEFSVAEVLYALGHRGVGRATAFISHMQKEDLSDTLRGIKHYAEMCWFWEPFCWLDYFTLRQCVNDFDLAIMTSKIQEVGKTVVLTRELGETPEAAKRLFCVFEWYATLLQGRQKPFVISPWTHHSFLTCKVAGMKLSHCWSGGSSGDLVPMTPVNAENAEARKPADKTQIDKMITDGPGWKKLDEQTQAALQKADTMSKRQAFCGHLTAAAFVLLYLFFETAGAEMILYIKDHKL